MRVRGNAEDIGMLEIPDLNNVSSILNHLSNLVNMSLSIYGGKGNVILAPASEDKFLSALKASQRGRDEYNDFLKSCIEKTVNKKDSLVAKGPAGQHYFFVPVHVNNVTFVIAASGVYLSLKEFEDFYLRDGRSYDLNPEEFKAWSQMVIIRDHATLRETAQHIQTMVNQFFSIRYEGSLNEKKYKLTKTILSLIADIDLDMRVEEIYDIVIDILLFLFNVDNVSVMIKHDDVFSPQRVAGRLRLRLQSVTLKGAGILSEAVEKQKHIYSDNMMEILRLGLPDEVTSVHAFPIVTKDKMARLLGVFNSRLSQDDVDIIAELCKVVSFILRLRDFHDSYEKRKKDMDILNTVITRLNEVKEPEELYETIMDMSVHLAHAERGSLMLMENGNAYLSIKAAKGINKKLLKEIKIKVGEGVAGKVFGEGIPLMVYDIEKDERVLLPRKPSYKTSSFVSIPLKLGEKAIGVLNISDKMEGEVFSEEDMTLLGSFASYASIALERSMYYSLVGHLRELSITDSLTGLFNKRYFEERFFEELQRSERHNLSFSLAMLDIDDFKLFNDTEGHLSGDEVLKNIANIAKESTRVIDIMARFGGEEFAIIMPQTEKDEAFFVAERIRKSVREQLFHTWTYFPKERITVTVGVATFPSDGKGMKDLIQNADRALYKGKKDGKDRTLLYSKESPAVGESYK
jgi:diguanylate cyclase (GGDEF)-like protein